MKIAQVAPLIESVPPKKYGGTERIVSYLTEELVEQGHEVALFASGDSATSAQLISGSKQPLRHIKYEDLWCANVLMLEKVASMAPAFDVIHFHTGVEHFPLARRLAQSHITTHHGRLDMPAMQPFLQEFSDIPVTSISENQRTNFSAANWVATVYNGIPGNLYTYQPQSGDYLAFLGRISPEKGILSAIEIAKKLDMELVISAKVDNADKSYFETIIKPLLQEPKINYIGEINDKEKNDFLGHALALLFPIAWPEPFGLVMIESMACGTPVVAYNCGSVPEVMQDGVTGFIVDGIDGATAAVEKIHTISRRQCRRVFEDRFTSRRMAMDYLNIYERMVMQNGQTRTVS